MKARRPALAAVALLIVLAAAPPTVALTFDTDEDSAWSRLH